MWRFRCVRVACGYAIVARGFSVSRLSCQTFMPGGSLGQCERGSGEKAAGGERSTLDEVPRSQEIKVPKQ